MVLGGGKYGFRVWGTFLGEEASENRVFHAKDIFITCNFCLGGLLGAQRTSSWLLAGNGLSTTLGPSAQFPSVGIALSAPFSLSGRPKVIIFKIPTVRL